ncbi:hypothetical protein D3C72_2124250 [compost metagenome]
MGIDCPLPSGLFGFHDRMVQNFLPMILATDGFIRSNGCGNFQLGPAASLYFDITDRTFHSQRRSAAGLRAVDDLLLHSGRTQTVSRKIGCALHNLSRAVYGCAYSLADGIAYRPRCFFNAVI